MAVHRNEALKRLAGLTEQVELHLEIINANPGDPSTEHHQNEIRNWLRTMEAVLLHVGEKNGSTANPDHGLQDCSRRLGPCQVIPD